MTGSPPSIVAAKGLHSPTSRFLRLRLPNPSCAIKLNKSFCTGEKRKCPNDSKKRKNICVNFSRSNESSLGRGRFQNLAVEKQSLAQRIVANILHGGFAIHGERRRGACALAEDHEDRFHPNRTIRAAGTSERADRVSAGSAVSASGVSPSSAATPPIRSVVSRLRIRKGQ